MNISLEDIKKWAFENMEGAEEPEFTLYDDILFSIKKYEWDCRNREFYLNSGMREAIEQQIDPESLPEAAYIW